jgi:hypothetical protein
MKFQAMWTCTNPTYTASVSATIHKTTARSGIGPLATAVLNIWPDK